MSHWNHRVVRRTYPDGGGHMYAIHEVYYGLEEDERPAPTEEPIGVVGESVGELRETLERMLRALEKPVLDYDTREEVT